MIDPALRIAALAAGAPDLRSYREGVLDVLAPHVPFDLALAHAGSPRVPLETAATRGVSIEAIRPTLGAWDRYAVELARFRTHALAHGGVATDSEALAARGRARTIFERAFGAGRRVRRGALVHLVVRERVVGLIALLRARDVPFAPREAALLRALMPAIAAGDALQSRLDASARADVPVRLSCQDSRLTRRQRDIVEHVALGHTNAQIGAALHLSPNTVRNQLAATMKRLDAANRADVVRLAVLRPA